MDMIDAPIPVEKPTGPIVGQTQPVGVLGALDAPMDDAAVRQAIAAAESKGAEPEALTTSDLSQVQAPTQETKAPEVPEKFLKPDGGVDVEKIAASTRQLDEAIQKKEEATAKTVEDYLSEYRQKEAKFRSMPNPEKLAANLQANPPQQVDVTSLPTQQLEDMIRKDFQNDPAITTVKLIELALQQKLAPIEAKERENKTRENLQSLAKNDPRILNPQVFAAINAKLDADPDYWKLKNPHKAAWLEVKEEMRLGEPSQVQAQPSRLPSPVLGGGTPPSAPSSYVPQNQNPLNNLAALDLKDRKQEAIGDEAIRAFLAGKR